MSSQRKYTIQEIRDMLVDMSDNMNVYQKLDAANGINVVQKFLSEIQERDKLKEKQR